MWGGVGGGKTLTQSYYHLNFMIRVTLENKLIGLHTHTHTQMKASIKMMVLLNFRYDVRSFWGAPVLTLGIGEDTLSC